MGNRATTTTTTCTQQVSNCNSERPNSGDQRIRGSALRRTTDIATQHPAYDDTFRVVVVGDSRSGKTSLVERYTKCEFNARTRETVGVDFASVPVKSPDAVYRLQIFDTAGASRYQKISSAYFRSCKAFVVAVDCTSTTQFDRIRSWIDEIRGVVGCDDDVTIVIALTKTDERETRCISLESVREVTEGCGVSCVETSAKNNDNVDELFERLAGSIVEKQRRDNNTRTTRLTMEPSPVVCK